MHGCILVIRQRTVNSSISCLSTWLGTVFMFFSSMDAYISRRREVMSDLKCFPIGRRNRDWIDHSELHEGTAIVVRWMTDFKSRRVSPHCLRHSNVMHLLQAGVDIIVIALWLGHESATTTHMYVQTDLATKERALARLLAWPTRKEMSRACVLAPARSPVMCRDSEPRFGLAITM